MNYLHHLASQISLFEEICYFEYVINPAGGQKFGGFTTFLNIMVCLERIYWNWLFFSILQER